MSTSSSSPCTEKANCGKKVRSRRSHNKVKTGCSTCKIRRKKCDETKPACLRCVNTGRKCDGYVEIQSSASPSMTEIAVNNLTLSSRQSIQSHSKLQIQWPPTNNRSRDALWQPPSRYPPQSLFASELHVLCFDYFRTMTGPQLGRYLFNTLWSTVVIRAALLHPAVMKAVVAVGAAHRRHDLGISREAFEYCAISEKFFSEARQALDEIESHYDDQICPNELLLVTQALYGVFEVFQGNFDAAAQHVAQGLKATWHRPHSVLHSQTQRYSPQLRPELFHKLYRQLLTFAQKVLGGQLCILTDFQKEPMPIIPPTFASYEDAFNHMYTQAEYLLHVPTTVWTDDSGRRKLQTIHVSRILQWNAALAESADLSGTTKVERRCKHSLLRKTRNVTYLLLYLVLFAMHDSKHKHSDVRNPPAAHSKNDTKPDNALDTITHRTFGDVHTYSSHQGTTNFQSIEKGFEELEDDSVIESSQLWRYIEQDEYIRTNILRVMMLVDHLVNSLADSEDEVYALSLNVDTGIGPPRSSMPGTEGSSKTRHLVLALLDEASRDEVYSQSQSWSMSSSDLGTTTSSENLNLTVLDHSHRDAPQLDLKPNTDANNSSPKNSTGHYSTAYGIAEQMCSIEEHAVLAAAEKSLIVPPGLKPQWLDISYYLEERRIRVRYCHRDDGGDDCSDANTTTAATATAVGDNDGSQTSFGPSAGLVWTHKWLAF